MRTITPTTPTMLPHRNGIVKVSLTTSGVALYAVMLSLLGIAVQSSTDERAGRILIRVAPHHEMAVSGHGDDAAIGGGATLDRPAFSTGKSGEHHGKGNDRRNDDHQYDAEDERGDGAAATGQRRCGHRRGSTVALRGWTTRAGSAVRGHRMGLARRTVGGT